jgi:alcohol dehydrogenase class IV
MELVSRPGVPLILIPTTAGGTGSEMISICVLSDTKNKVKKDLMSGHMFAREALLNPQLTLALPPRVTVITGMDALVHAIESLAGDPDTSQGAAAARPQWLSAQQQAG